jgi:hypothetical protein
MHAPLGCEARARSAATHTAARCAYAQRDGGLAHVDDQATGTVNIVGSNLSGLSATVRSVHAAAPSPRARAWVHARQHTRTPAHAHHTTSPHRQAHIDSRTHARDHTHASAGVGSAGRMRRPWRHACAAAAQGNGGLVASLGTGTVGVAGSHLHGISAQVRPACVRVRCVCGCSPSCVRMGMCVCACM